jgi:DNA polymerase-1
MPREPAKKLFLVDAMGFIFRAYHAPMARLDSPSGIPTKVPYLFSTMLRRLMKDWEPDYLAVVFDVSGPTFRDKLFAEYKAQRPPMPEDLSVQLPYVRRLCEAMRLPILEYQGYEADDVIGALAKQATGKKLDVYIVTSDKDMMQLVGKTVRVLRPGSGPNKTDLVVDEAKVEEILGVPPLKVPDVMALMGDSIDNIPGAKGIGEKGARELIQRFGSAEAALKNAAKVEGKRYREALINSHDLVLLSKKLAIIDTTAPVPLDLGALGRSSADVEALRSLYVELGFSSLLRDLPAASPTPGATQTDSTQLDSPAAVREFLNSVARGQEIALWLSMAPGERDSEGFGSRAAAIELSPKPGVARTAWLDEKGEIGAALKPWLGDPSRPKIVHDPKLNELLLGPGVAGIRHATMLYSYLLRPTTAKHGLADVSLRHLNTNLAGTPGEAADCLQKLAPILRKEVEAQDMARLYEEIDLPLAPVLAEMERIGVRVDPKALAAMSETMEREVRSLEKTIWEMAGSEFNVNSPQQLAEILFDKLNLQPPARRGAAKARSTAADVLEQLALVHELPRKVIEYREVAKLKSTYVDALPKLIHPETGRLHTSFSQTGTATGRLSSSDPNLQNIPVRTELGRQIRAAFVAERGCTLLSADYSQIELRILAHFSGDPVLVEAFRSGEDIHSRTAQEVFGVGPLAQTPEHRRVAKVINFGIIYGLSAFGLAQQLGIEQKEAAQFIAAYFNRYRGVKDYLDRSLAEVRKAGYTLTLFGRRRPIPEINAPQMNLRSFAERTALNTPLQGTAADLIKCAMIDLARRLTDERLKTRMILQVHDELLFEVPPDELDRFRTLVKSSMEQVRLFEGALKVPLVVDLKAGPNWRDMW